MGRSAAKEAHAWAQAVESGSARQRLRIEAKAVLVLGDCGGPRQSCAGRAADVYGPKTGLAVKWFGCEGRRRGEGGESGDAGRENRVEGIRGRANWRPHLCSPIRD